MIYVLGGRGFVGSAFARLFERLNAPHEIITRENYDRFRGTSCDLLINANGNSRKYLADRDPLGDFDASVRSVAESLQAFRSHRYVLLSSGDVYPDQTSPETTLEAAAIDPARSSRYGRHKWLAEQIVRGEHQNWLVFRMGGFVGRGLKKNAIFDMLSGAPVRLNPESRLQFINTDNAANLIWSIAASDFRKEVFNLGARGGVHLGELHRACGSTSSFEAGAPTVRYELSLDKLEHASTLPLPNSADEVSAFIAAWPPAGGSDE